ncbi:MAG: hypothetical protein ACRDSO_15810 [Pseudonocardiaceae bacterium]
MRCRDVVHDRGGAGVLPALAQLRPLRGGDVDGDVPAAYVGDPVVQRDASVSGGSSGPTGGRLVIRRASRAACPVRAATKGDLGIFGTVAA